MKVSIVICGLNCKHFVPYILQSLYEQTYHGNDWEIIFVDNGSDDGTVTIVKQWQTKLTNLRLEVQPKTGLSHARNLGWQRARGIYVAYIDADAKADKNWLEILMTTIDATEAQVIGGDLSPWFVDPPPVWFSTALESASWSQSAGYLSTHNARYGFYGSNMVIARQLLQTHEGFNVAYGMHGNKIVMGEESELFNRLWMAGVSFWYQPTLLVYHAITKKHYNVVNRMRRSFQVGRARARIDGKRIGRKSFLKNIGIFGFPHGLVFAHKLFHAHNRRQLGVSFIQQVCNNWGYQWQSLRGDK